MKSFLHPNPAEWARFLPYSRPQNPYRNPSNWSKIALTLLIGKAGGSWITYYFLSESVRTILGRIHGYGSNLSSLSFTGDMANGSFVLTGGGRGFGGMGGGTSLGPLINADNSQQPLAYKLLAAMELRAKYLEIVRDIAEKWLDWDKLGPIAKCYHDLIADDIKADTKKLYSTEGFESGLK
jgi:hypothetical protein